MATIATADDVIVRWGKAIEDVDPAIVALIDVRLGDAERMIRRRIKDLDAKITAGDIDPEDVKQVEAEALLRLVRNPDGFLSETDGNYTYMLQTELSSGKLEILQDEWEILGYVRSRMAILVPDPVLGT